MGGATSVPIDSEEYPLNLMLFTRMPEDNWRDYYYTALDEFIAPEKALSRWARFE